MLPLILFFDSLTENYFDICGAKASSLALLYNRYSTVSKVPYGFVLTTAAYQEFMKFNGFSEILNINTSEEAESLRKRIIDAVIPPYLFDEFSLAYKKFFSQKNKKEIRFAVRSSATAEDLPDASFAGQQESFLDIQGIEDILLHYKKVAASLFLWRAVEYRKSKNINNNSLGMAVIIQEMIDARNAGTLFTADPETGSHDLMVIASSYGLGELLVQGTIDPDEYILSKRSLQNEYYPLIKKSRGKKEFFIKDKSVVETPENDSIQFSLSDNDVIKLSHIALHIENFFTFSQALDIEWVQDHEGEFWIVQSRPLVGLSHFSVSEKKTYRLLGSGNSILSGIAVGDAIVQGNCFVANSVSDAYLMPDQAILVVEYTSPDWVPFMKRASAVITARGGRTCHAALIAREFSIPTLVGAHSCMDILSSGKQITLDCSSGQCGRVYDGLIDYSVVKENTQDDLSYVPPCNIYAIVADLQSAWKAARAGFDGIGLVRLAIASIALAFPHKPVIVRMSDFKSNEYKNLLGGNVFELIGEENPMIGFRGASRYLSSDFAACFDLECEAFCKARDFFGADTINIMIPFVRTVDEIKRIREKLCINAVLAEDFSTQLYMMVEIPSNVICMEEFAEYVDGFSIGSNDMTQLVLGVDRDSSFLSTLYNESDTAVKRILTMAVEKARMLKKPIGICGQAPADMPEIAKMLIDRGINSIAIPVNSYSHFLRSLDAYNKSVCNENFSCIENKDLGKVVNAI